MGDFLKRTCIDFAPKKARIMSVENKTCAVSQEFTLR